MLQRISKIYCQVLMFFVFLSVLNLAVLGQEDERLLEHVAITNIEVPVRVMDEQGRSITDLVVEDFQLFEDDKPVRINGFYLKRKKLTGIGTVPVDASHGDNKKMEPRTFVLAFQLTSLANEVEKALDYLLTEVLRQGDRIIVFTRKRTIDFPAFDPMEAMNFKAKVLLELKTESRLQKANLYKVLDKLTTGLANARQGSISQAPQENAIPILSDGSVNQYLSDEEMRLLQEYIAYWEEYKRRELIPDTATFYRFANYLKGLKGQKWVFNFYQIDHFPTVKRGSSIRERLSRHGMMSMGGGIKEVMSKFDTMFTVNPQDYPWEEVSKLFSHVDATFHSFILRGNTDVLHEEIEYERVSSSIEVLLSSITRLTGGQNLASNDLTASLETVAQLEDAYYMLTYAPPSNQAGKISVKVGRDKAKVFYDDQSRADYIRQILSRLESEQSVGHLKLGGLKLEPPILLFGISGIRLVNESGRVRVGIRIIDADDRERFSDAKELTARKKSLAISLKILDGLSRGRYRLIIDALDRGTQQKDVVYQSFSIE